MPLAILYNLRKKSGSKLKYWQIYSNSTTQIPLTGVTPLYIEVLNVKVHVFVLLLFATLPDCSQNQTAVSDTLRLLSDF